MPCYTTHNYTRKDINIPTETITIRVDARAVQAFKSAPEAQRQKLEQLLSLRLLEASQANEPLESLMRRISQNAQQRGLTPEILQDILNDEEDS